MDHSSSSLGRCSSQSLCLASSLERMELEHHDDNEPSFHNDDDAEYGEDQQLFGGGGDNINSRAVRRKNNSNSGKDNDGIHLIRSEHCCSWYLPKSYVGRLVIMISVACNIFALVRSVQQASTSSPSGMPLLPLVVNSKNGRADCATALSTFPNSGTSWTQAVFTASTGIASLAVYPGEGPRSPFQPKSYVHNAIGPGSRLPDPTHGECLFVKTHHRIPYGSLADNHPQQRYQRAVVLYREPEDNLHANLRYLTKLRNENKADLLKVCSHDPQGTPLPEDTNFEDWSNSINAADYADLIDLHRWAHRRFYCHAERYPAPTMMVTYARLLSDPRGTFRDILTFSGYADADIEKALEVHPPRSHDVHGSLDYVPVDLGEEEEEEGDKFDEEDPCAGMSRRFQKLWNKASPCVKAAAKMLQFV